MQICILGTAAAEGLPGLFCHCPCCERARALGGKNIRTRTSLVIDEAWMVDFPPDTYLHTLRGHVDPSKVRHLFITHAHMDHLFPEDLIMRGEPFAHFLEPFPLHIYGNALVGHWMHGERGLHLDRAGIVFHRIRPFQTVEAGEMTVRTLQADHDTMNQEALLYLFSRGEQTVLVGFDTGWCPEETWGALQGVRLDVAIMDCTNGKLPGERGHMGVEPLIRLKERLVKEGMLKPEGQVVATHFSHNGGLSHAELEDRLNPAGIAVAYDGMVVEVRGT